MGEGAERFGALRVAPLPCPSPNSKHGSHQRLNIEERFWAGIWADPNLVITRTTHPNDREGMCDLLSHLPRVDSGMHENRVARIARAYCDGYARGWKYISNKCLSRMGHETGKEKEEEHCVERRRMESLPNSHGVLLSAP